MFNPASIKLTSFLCVFCCCFFPQGIKMEVACRLESTDIRLISKAWNTRDVLQKNEGNRIQKVKRLNFFLVFFTVQYYRGVLLIKFRRIYVHNIPNQHDSRLYISYDSFSTSFHHPNSFLSIVPIPPSWSSLAYSGFGAGQIPS